MKITEIDSGFCLTESSAEINVLLTVLQYVKSRMEEKNLTDRKIKTDTLIKLIKNSGFPAFDYNVLSELYTTNSIVKNHLSDINAQYVSFSSEEPEQEKSADKIKPKEDPYKDKVSALAKKATKL